VEFPLAQEGDIMRRPFWYLVLIVVLVFCASAIEAQTIVVNGVVYAPVDPNYGIPAAPGPVANGSVRHYNNGYVGVNSRHYSRIPMKWGTGPIRATGPIVSYPGYRHGYRPGYRMPYRGGYVHGAVGPRGGYVGGAYHGQGWYIRGGVSFR
jgi:hypothetical protein